MHTAEINEKIVERYRYSRALLYNTTEMEAYATRIQSFSTTGHWTRIENEAGPYVYTTTQQFYSFKHVDHALSTKSHSHVCHPRTQTGDFFLQELTSRSLLGIYLTCPGIGPQKSKLYALLLLSTTASHTTLEYSVLLRVLRSEVFETTDLSPFRHVCHQRFYIPLISSCKKGVISLHYTFPSYISLSQFHHIPLSKTRWHSVNRRTAIYKQVE